MSETQIRLTRAELYQKVWAAPMAAVAKKFALSPWALSKVCRRHNIPIPPFGYWARIAVGHKITPPALIPDEGGQETVEIYIPEWDSSKLAVPTVEATRKIEIPDVLSHPLILKIEELLASAKENDRKLIGPNPGKPPYILVSRQQLPRALRILNALFQALEKEGHTVSWLPDESAALTVNVEGESVAFSLLELIMRVPHVLTRTEKTILIGPADGITNSPAGCVSQSITCRTPRNRNEPHGQIQRFKLSKTVSETFSFGSEMHLVRSRGIGFTGRSSTAITRKCSSDSKCGKDLRENANEKPGSSADSSRGGKRPSGSGGLSKQSPNESCNSNCQTRKDAMYNRCWTGAPNTPRLSIPYLTFPVLLTSSCLPKGNAKH